VEAWDVIVGDIGDEARAHENVQLVAENRNSAILNAMKTAAELESGFGLYFKELAECEKQNCWWALLHVLVALPDICAAMDGRPQGGQRYIDWCLENFTANPIMSPGDRYQMRCSLLHEGRSSPKSCVEERGGVEG